MTTKEAAIALGGITDRAVRKWCKKFGWRKHGRDYVLTAKQVQKIDKRRRGWA